MNSSRDQATLSVVDLETTRLILKPWRKDYTDDFARLCADKTVMKHISKGHALTHDEASKISERATGLWAEHSVDIAKDADQRF